MSENKPTPPPSGDQPRVNLGYLVPPPPPPPKQAVQDQAPPPPPNPKK